MSDFDGDFANGDGCIVCGPDEDCECDDGPVSTDYEYDRCSTCGLYDADCECFADDFNEYEDERQALRGTSQCDGLCDPRCGWCLVAHECPIDHAGEPCPYDALEAQWMRHTDPAPSPRDDCQLRKSKYGRAPNVRNVDRNKQAADRVRGQLRRDGKLKYGKAKR